MSYFKPQFIKFFKGLAKNNNKAYFDSNRKVYEEEVREPFKELVGDLILRMQEFDPELAIEPKDAIFRINRDIRFSKDKTPYKTHVSAHISRGGKKDHTRPGLFFHINHEGIMVGSGVYMVEKEDLQRIRTHIANNMEEFASLLEDPKFKERFGTVKGDAHKRIPKEFQEAHASQPLIANKQFYYMANIGPEPVTTEELPEVLIDTYRTALPMNEFLRNGLQG
jgi:uncharacterized protein (TIGR02453 family)